MEGPGEGGVYHDLYRIGAPQQKGEVALSPGLHDNVIARWCHAPEPGVTSRGQAAHFPQDATRFRVRALRSPPGYLRPALSGPKWHAKAISRPFHTVRTGNAAKPAKEKHS